MSNSHAIFLIDENEKRELQSFLGEILFDFRIYEEESLTIVEFSSSKYSLLYDSLRAYIFDMCPKFHSLFLNNIDLKEKLILSKIKSFLVTSDDNISTEKDFLENTIKSNSSELKDYVLGKYNKDVEMINTIKGFVENDLNVSKAAKELYLHRNTLINRLDRFYEKTGYDMRSFKDAYIIYTLIK